MSEIEATPEQDHSKAAAVEVLAHAAEAVLSLQKMTGDTLGISSPVVVGSCSSCGAGSCL